MILSESRFYAKTVSVPYVTCLFSSKSGRFLMKLSTEFDLIAEGGCRCTWLLLDLFFLYERKYLNQKLEKYPLKL